MPENKVTDETSSSLKYNCTRFNLKCLFGVSAVFVWSVNILLILSQSALLFSVQCSIQRLVRYDRNSAETLQQTTYKTLHFITCNCQLLFCWKAYSPNFTNNKCPDIHPAGRLHNKGRRKHKKYLRLCRQGRCKAVLPVPLQSSSQLLLPAPVPGPVLPLPRLQCCRASNSVPVCAGLH